MTIQSIYIDSTVSDGGTGSEANPYNAISDIDWEVVSAWVAQGDSPEINLKRGSVFTDLSTLTTSGTERNPIVFQAYGSGANPKFSRAGSSIRLQNAHHLSFYDIIFDGQDADGFGIYTPGSDNYSDNLTLVRVEITKYNLYGLYVYSSGITIEDSIVHHNAGGGIVVINSETDVEGVIITNTDAYNNGQTGCNIKKYNQVFVEGCAFYKNGSEVDGTNYDGLVVNGCTNIIVRRNVSHDNYTKEGSGLDVSSDPGYPITGVFEFNESYNNEGKGISISGSEDDNFMKINYNLTYDNNYNFINYGTKSTAHFYHNFCGNAVSAGFRFGYTDTDDIDNVLKNNIIWGAYPYAFLYLHPTTAIFDNNYNTIKDGTTAFAKIGDVDKTFVEWQSEIGTDLNSNQNDPTLTAVYSLKAFSPCINAGTTILGINERGSVGFWGTVNGSPNIGPDQLAMIDLNKRSFLFNAALGISPVATDFDIAPDELGHATDGYDDTSTGIGTTVTDGIGNIGNIDIALPDNGVYLVSAKVYTNRTEGAGNCGIYLYSKPDGINWQKIEKVRYSTASEVITNILFCIVTGKDFRFNFYASGAGTFDVKIYSITAYLLEKK